MFLTADKNLRYQQDLSGRKMAVVVLGNSPWHLVRLHIPEIVAAVNTAVNGSYVEVAIPLPRKPPLCIRELVILKSYWERPEATSFDQAKRISCLHAAFDRLPMDGYACQAAREKNFESAESSVPVV